MHHSIESVGDDSVLCAIGNHRHHGTGRLCADHVAETQDLIVDTARMTGLCGDLLMPSGGTRPGEKVSTSRVGSPTSPRLDALNLVGPGGREIRRDARNMVPQVRRWSTMHTYTVTTPDGPQRRTTRWYHTETVTAGPAPARVCRCGQDHSTGKSGRPVLVADDDQVGVIPPAEWMDEWVRRWRLIMSHHVRTGGRGGEWIDYEPTEPDQDKRLTRAALGEWMRMSAGRPHLLRPVAAWLALRVAYQSARTQLPAVLLGLRNDGPAQTARADDALAGARPPAVAHDPDTAGWALRYGTGRNVAAVTVDARYLRQWLPTVAALDDGDPDGPDLDTFVRELRALHRELQHVVGESRDEQRLGRCPVRLVDADGEETDRRCGAVLWHDPHRPGWRIQCARCHTSWPERQWLRLSTEIRNAWPIDPHRRYTPADRRQADTAATMPCCEGCERTMVVDWQPSPVRGDREPMWRPAGLLCPAGCLSGGITGRRAVMLTAAA